MPKNAEGSKRKFAQSQQQAARGAKCIVKTVQPSSGNEWVCGRMVLHLAVDQAPRGTGGSNPSAPTTRLEPLIHDYLFGRNQTRGFYNLLETILCFVAQLVERSTVNRDGVGSRPTEAATFWFCVPTATMLDCLSGNTGSIPVRTATSF
jgi:hypothetical protein